MQLPVKYMQMPSAVGGSSSDRDLAIEMHRMLQQVLLRLETLESLIRGRPPASAATASATPSSAQPPASAATATEPVEVLVVYSTAKQDQYQPQMEAYIKTICDGQGFTLKPVSTTPEELSQAIQDSQARGRIKPIVFWTTYCPNPRFVHDPVRYNEIKGLCDFRGIPVFLIILKRGVAVQEMDVKSVSTMITESGGTLPDSIYQVTLSSELDVAKSGIIYTKHTRTQIDLDLMRNNLAILLSSSRISWSGNS